MREAKNVNFYQLEGNGVNEVEGEKFPKREVFVIDEWSH
jgi:hypothetical protein